MPSNNTHYKPTISHEIIFHHIPLDTLKLYPTRSSYIQLYPNMSHYPLYIPLKYIPLCPNKIIVSYPLVNYPN